MKAEEALNRWREGPDAWNRWINSNHSAEVDFSNVDFSKERDANGKLSFSGYHFGEGNVSFEYAKFGSGDVNFSKTVFNSRSVSFDGAEFNDGRISFNSAVFRGGAVSFSAAKFGNSRVSFQDAVFSSGGLSFTDAVFGIGKISFKRAHFGNGNALFDGVNFGDGDVTFEQTKLSSHTVSFENSTFGKGNLNFSNSKFDSKFIVFTGTDFSTGDVKFDNVSFGSASVSFYNTLFGDGDVSFQRATFANMTFIPTFFGSSSFKGGQMKVEGPAVFHLPDNTSFLKRFDLRGATFDGPLTLELDGKTHLHAVPDLRGVKSAHHVELSGLTTSLRRISPKPSWPPKLSTIAEDPHDAARLRRLKEIAEVNRDHRAALRFSADENRALRWHQTSWLASFLDMLFDFFSDYGQSIFRPAVLLFSLTLAATGLYSYLSDNAQADSEQALRLSLANGLPFLPLSRSLRNSASEALFCNGPDFWTDAAMIGQGTLSIMLLFLIGLGLRNRFRL